VRVRVFQGKGEDIAESLQRHSCAVGCGFREIPVHLGSKSAVSLVTKCPSKVALVQHVNICSITAPIDDCHINLDTLHVNPEP
jgi:hypothetical protein